MTDASATMMSKVAEVTAVFWLLKIIATTLGETAGDFVSMTLGVGCYAALAITVAVLVLVLFMQIKSTVYHPAMFWATIVATTTAGMEISDLMDRSLGLGYAVGSLILATGLLATLAVWYWRDGSLNVYPMFRKDTEITFWIAVVFSNSLGTAFGDFLVDNLGFHFLEGAFVTAGVIGLVILLHYFTRINHILLFWIAFIFTRPFGATFGDFLTKPLDIGGLNLPRDTASLIALALMVIIGLGSAHLAKRKPSAFVTEARTK